MKTVFFLALLTIVIAVVGVHSSRADGCCCPDGTWHEDGNCE